MIINFYKSWPFIKGTLLRTWPFILLAIVTTLHIARVIRVDGYAIGLLVLTFLPLILKTITTYFDTFKIGKDGVEAKAVADNRGKTSDELQEWIIVANSKPVEDSVFPYSANSRAILATLWHYQKKLFGEESLQRWGFGIGIGAPQYRRYENGLQNLVESNLIHEDHRGLCYLTNEGIKFCKEHTTILDADGPYYS
ncbi:MAG: hypothetical protein ACK46A_13875, partial [Akkermansiaceae bacterium]